MSDLTFPPSKGDLWGNCAMYPTMLKQFPRMTEQDNQQAEVGKACHWVVQKALESMRENHGRGWHGRSYFLNKKSPNGIIIDNEIIDSADVMVGVVADLVRDKPHLIADIEVEKKINVSDVHGNCNGRIDVVIPDYINRMLYVYDMKHGHRPVDAFESKQLLLGASGFMSEKCSNPDAWQVTMTIVQPRSYAPDSEPWVVRATELDGHVDHLRTKAENALQPSPIASTGSWCGKCPGSDACSAFQKTAAHALDVSEECEIHELPEHAVSVELTFIARALEILKDRKSGLEARVERLARDGKQVPGWSMRTGRASDKWKADVDVIGGLLGLDLMHDPKPITPKQAKTMISKAGLPIDPSVLDPFITSASGKMSLKQDDEKYIRKVFNLLRNRG